jgi:RNA polymerase sigma-70 factor (ECF subfamily)
MTARPAIAGSTDVAADTPASADARYREAIGQFGPAIARVARGYERDPASRADLLQEIHIALWRSLAGFDGRSSLRTWVYRVAHNIGATHVRQALRRRERASLRTLEDLAEEPAADDVIAQVDTRRLLERAFGVIHRLPGAGAAA